MLLIFLAMLKGLTQFRRNVLETFDCAEQLIARQTTNEDGAKLPDRIDKELTLNPVTL